MDTRLFHLHTLSALHCGTGQSVGVVDLPIARARATQLPIVPGSSLRGVLRQHIEAHDRPLAMQLFGPRLVSGDDQSFAGAMAVGDAHLLSLPIRALAGISCFVTSPFILTRYARDLRASGIDTPSIPAPKDEQAALVVSDSVNRLDGKLILEELDLTPKPSHEADTWAAWIAERAHPADTDGQRDFRCRFAIVSDAIMGFLSETATELRTRISIDQRTGTVKESALWYEEHLPAESILWGVYALGDSRQRSAEGGPTPAAGLAAQLLSHAPADTGLLLQLGGQAGVGRGLVRLLPMERPA